MCDVPGDLISPIPSTLGLVAGYASQRHSGEVEFTGDGGAPVSVCLSRTQRCQRSVEVRGCRTQQSTAEW